MDAEVYPQEVLADEEPKYLRRQKPLEIKRRKFGKKAWSTYFRVSLWVVAGVAAATAAYECVNFVYTAREMKLIHPDQISIANNHYVSPASVREIFAADRSKSVLRIPLDLRRQQLETIPWVEQATVRRALPNKIEVEITERTPIAFLRAGTELALVDAHGVILERPVEGDFHFPVATGMNSEMPLDERERRMQMFAGFMHSIESARSGASEQVSEVDLADAHDLHASLTGFGSAVAGNGTDTPILVHFGDTDFEGKYQTLVENIAQWRATAGPIESVDLRFSREAVVNQDRALVAQLHETKRPVAHAAAKKHSR
jgi:cell division protein FtsQ